MKTIILTRGKLALVDNADFDWLNQWKWSACYTVSKRVGKLWYAYRREMINGASVRISMHRFILGLSSENEKFGEHEDNNGLNNQRYNLREATRAQNGCNAAKRIDNTSGFKGVSFVKNRNLFQSKLQHHGKQIHCGLHSTAELAFAARNKLAETLHADFARQQ